MALKPTIYKLKVSLSDLDSNYYNTCNLTIARHPSETAERMMARVLAYCLNITADDASALSFTKGLSAVEEPDIWARTLDDQIKLWIDIGEPAFDRMKKASRSSSQAKVYSFNTKSDVWWEQGKSKFKKLNIEIVRFDPMEIKALSQLVNRSMDFSVTVTGHSAFIASELGECEVSWSVLQEQS